MANAPVKVLLADDSAVIRGILTRALESDPDIKIVSSVSDGQMAAGAAFTAQPDIVILDTDMPVMDGVTALPKILIASPKSKVIMFASPNEKDGDAAMAAFALGAAECLIRPANAQQAADGSKFQKNLLQLVKTLSKRGGTVTGAFTLHKSPDTFHGKPEIIVIGAGAGGPQALFSIFKHFKNFDAPVVITQHMPGAFAPVLARRIEQETGIPAHEVTEGMIPAKGHIYVAPGGYHLSLAGTGAHAMFHLDDGMPENGQKPSIDFMFRSACAAYGNKVLGILLTGMGGDGAEGAKTIAQAGGRIIAQDEASSVIWGIPGAAAKAGACAAVLPLNDIGPWVRTTVTAQRIKS